MPAGQTLDFERRMPLAANPGPCWWRERIFNLARLSVGIGSYHYLVLAGVSFTPLAPLVRSFLSTGSVTAMNQPSDRRPPALWC
jgi:hypothetical protein